jgi:hypothetical protein
VTALVGAAGRHCPTADVMLPGRSFSRGGTARGERTQLVSQPIERLPAMPRDTAGQGQVKDAADSADHNPTSVILAPRSFILRATTPAGMRLRPLTVIPAPPPTPG